MRAPAELAEVPRRIFSPIARDYDRPALVLSLFQYRRWHRFLLSRVLLPSGELKNAPTPRPARPEALVEPALSVAKGRAAATTLPTAATPAPTTLRVLDLATGTGALAFDLLARTDAHVIGADISHPMLLRAQARLDGRFDGRLRLVECTAEALPFPEASFDAITFAYLLRYVGDVPETLRGLARLVKPGGAMASLDFAVPRGIWHPLWRLYTGAVLPAGGRLFSRDWQYVGVFLGPSIRDFYRRWPEQHLLQAWRDAGFADVRSQRLSLGGAIVIWGTKSV